MRESIEAKILEVLNYFSFFNYPPTFEEIYTFLKKKVRESDLASILQKLQQKKLIASKFSIKNNQFNTPSQYIIRRYQRSKIKDQRYISKFKNRCLVSKKKLGNLRFRLYIKLLSFFPQIKLIGLSGTLSMMNAQTKDDIDLFVITAENRLFTGRIIAVLLASILGIKRKFSSRQSPITSHQDKVCLNLFFDERNLVIPKYKQTEYVAHEALQMKPLINKNETYGRFLEANSWVFRIFPNAREIFNFPYVPQSKQFSNFLGNTIEFFLKQLQLTIIKQHQTSEVVTDTQLWFFPQDFEEKLLFNHKKKHATK